MSLFFEKAADRLGLPGGAPVFLPAVTLKGGEEVFVENHKGLLSYGEECVEINGGRLRIRIRGSGLSLKAMDRVCLVVTGKIFGVDVE